MSQERPKIGQLDSDQFDMWQALGGGRGLIEATVPGIVFVAVFVTSQNLTAAIISSLSLAIIAMAVRLATRTPVTQAVSGLGGILIGAALAWITGQAQDFYLWGLIVNVLFALAAVISIFIRRPLVGFFVQAFAPAAVGVEGAQGRFRAATWLWAGAFAARIAVQVPLYLNEEVGWLGSARVAMGLPLWAGVLWMTWIIVRPVIREVTEADPDLEESV